MTKDQDSIEGGNGGSKVTVTGSDLFIYGSSDDGVLTNVIDRGNEMNPEKLQETNLAAPCGFYCGTCRHYLARAKGLLEEKNLKHGCKGCRIQDKNCAFIKKECALIRKHEIGFCFKCDNFPCENLIKLDQRHYRDDNLNMIDDLRRIKKIGAKEWLTEQKDKWRCPKCGGNICVMDRECYDCGWKSIERRRGSKL